MLLLTRKAYHLKFTSTITSFATIQPAAAHGTYCARFLNLDLYKLINLI